MIHMVWVVPVVALFAAVCWYGLPQIARRARVRRLQRVCRRRRAVCLTFDDGPGERLTDELRGLLDDHGARATFFLLGRRVEAHEQPFARLSESNHEIASHSHDHLNAWKTHPSRVAKDVRAGWETIEGRIGRRLRFRPPYGKLTLAGWLQVVIGRHPLAWWTHDSGDTWGALPPVESVIDGLRLSGGGVVLLHDFDQDRSEERIRYVLDVTAAVLRMADAESLKMITMSELESTGV